LSLIQNHSISVSEKVKAETKKEAPKKEEPSSMFQRQRVDMLLGELLRKFPPTSMPQQPQLQQPQQQQQQQSPQQTNQQTTSGANTNVNNNIKTETPASVVDVKIEPSTNSQSETTSTLSPATQSDNLSNSGQEKADVKSEMKPPPEKKMKL
jgi:mediator of RNA polymerase II transcription subunit 6